MKEKGMEEERGSSSRPKASQMGWYVLQRGGGGARGRHASPQHLAA